MAAPLLFHFDFISPYAFLAWSRIHEVAARAGREVEPRPILFAALLDATGNKGPVEIPARRRFIIKDLLRQASLAGLRLALPPAHPFNPLLALRVASLPMEPALGWRAIDALYRAVWAGGPGVTEPDVVATVLREAGLDGPALVRAANEPDAKQRVRAQTEAAIAAGVFGVPTVIADGEIFFGFDNLPHLERFLRGEEKLDAGIVARWETLPAQATRRK